MTRNWRAGLAALAAAAMLTGACGGGARERAAEEDVAVGDESLLLPGSSTTAPAPAAAPAETTAVASKSAPTPAPTTAPAAKPKAQASATPPSTYYVDPSSSTSVAFPALALQSKTDRIAFAVLAEEGIQPTRDALTNAKTAIANVSRKPTDVLATVAAPAGTRNKAWSRQELVTLADRHLPKNSGSGTAVLRVVYVHGQLGNDQGVLGVSFTGTDVIAMFPDRIAAAATPIAPAGRIEVSVLTHETGHAFGLVDTYLNTGRQDPEHPGHSPNKRSVMYWAVESVSVAAVFDGGPPTSFDDADVADLAKIRDGAAAGSKG